MGWGWEGEVGFIVEPEMDEAGLIVELEMDGIGVQASF